MTNTTPELWLRLVPRITAQPDYPTLPKTSSNAFEEYRNQLDLFYEQQSLTPKGWDFVDV
jgi:hypothetical protein